MLNFKQEGFKYHFWVIGMIRSGIEPRSLEYFTHKTNGPVVEVHLSLQIIAMSMVIGMIKGSLY